MTAVSERSLASMEAPLDTDATSDAGDTTAPSTTASSKATDTPSQPESTRTGADELRIRALHMQHQLATILDSVSEIKKNCSRLKTENRFIQEYIETLMRR